MRFIIRADASREIGSGHVMRSSVLAEEAISRGYECIFIGEITDLDWVSEKISTIGFSQVLTNEHAFVPRSESDVLILDSYSIPVSNTFLAKENWKLIMTICDEITPKYVADIELRPGLMSFDGLKMQPVVLSGPEYALIRKGIVKSKKVKVSDDPIKVIVVGGGSDPYGFVVAMSRVICTLKWHLEAHLFTNELLPLPSGSNFVIHPIGADLDLIANEVDVILTTASTSSMEFVAREIPTGVVCAVDNQQDYYNQLGRLGHALQIGSRGVNTGWEFDLKAIDELLGSQNRRDLLKQSIKGLVDMKGAMRAIDSLISMYQNS